MNKYIKLLVFLSLLIASCTELYPPNKVKVLVSFGCDSIYLGETFNEINSKIKLKYATTPERWRFIKPYGIPRRKCHYGEQNVSAYYYFGFRDNRFLTQFEKWIHSDSVSMVEIRNDIFQQFKNKYGIERDTLMMRANCKCFVARKKKYTVVLFVPTKEYATKVYSIGYRIYYPVDSIFLPVEDESF